MCEKLLFFILNNDRELSYTLQVELCNIETLEWSKHPKLFSTMYSDVYRPFLWTGFIHRLSLAFDYYMVNTS
jgi:hypothetical protein